MSISEMHLSPKCVIKCHLIPPNIPHQPWPHHTHTHTHIFFFFADGHIMHNQPNKTTDSRLESWTHPPPPPPLPRRPSLLARSSLGVSGRPRAQHGQQKQGARRQKDPPPTTASPGSSCKFMDRKSTSVSKRPCLCVCVFFNARRTYF